jgi:dTDP-4-amino-4,6-dideoxygalactose transaminase
MNDNKIQTGLHYPHTINQMKYFLKNYKSLKFKNAEKLARECVSLPIDPMLKKNEVDYIVKTINNFN